MSGHPKNNELDNYDAEIVEDIPEQFDVSRYRKQGPTGVNSDSSNVILKPIPRYKSIQVSENDADESRYFDKNTYGLDKSMNRSYDQAYQMSIIQHTKPNIIPQSNMVLYPRPPRPNVYPRHVNTGLVHNPALNPNQQQLQRFSSMNPSYPISVFDPMQHGLHQHNPMDAQENSDYNTRGPSNYISSDGKLPDAAPSNKYEYQNDQDDSRYGIHRSRRKSRNEEKSRSSSLSSLHNIGFVVPGAYKSEKKSMHRDDDSDADLMSNENQKLSSSHPKSDTTNFRLSYSAAANHDNSLKSNLKSRKSGVKFDEKLEVFEINNPHYGTEIKSEKREMKKKKKDKRKEDEIIMKAKFDLKAKVQQKKSQLFYYYENSILFNALTYYEENYYRNSIIRLQEKIRCNNKLDDKTRDNFLQSIEKDNQNIIEIINSIKTEYMSKLQQFCMQFQCQPEHLHTFPGMMHTIHNVANSINYRDIINVYTSKDGDSASSTLSKILGGYDSKNEKLQLSNIQTSLKSPIKRKADIIPAKHIISAIDLHVKDVAMDRCKSITEIIFKLKEICETDLHVVRTIFKYVLQTQLETLRATETGSYIMRNFDMGMESANTIFSRMCSFAGIENKCIRGMWKNITCEPNEKTDLKCLWNIVNLTSSGWRFVQPAFTPVKIISRPDEKYEETEFYFLSDPESLFYEFLPVDKIWLFGDNSVSVKDFDRRPIITPLFRTLNLSIVSQSSNLIVNVEKEPFKLTIKYPHDLAETINFKYKLRMLASVSSGNKRLVHDQHGNDLANYTQHVISEIISNEDEVIFKVSSLPEIGTFNFTVYAEVADDVAPQAQLSTLSLANGLLTTSDNMKAIMSFKLTCNKLIHSDMPPNHINDTIHLFGMNNIMRKLGLLCCDFNKGIIGTDREGKVNLVFEMLQPLDVEFYLYSSDASISSKFLELCILKRVVHNFLILILYPPHPGLYGLDLHGAPRGTFNSLLHSQLPPIGKYLIKSHHQVRTFTQFPKGDNRDWGPKQLFYDLGLHTVGNMDPFIINEDGKQIEIEIAMLKPVTIWYKFDYDVNGTTKPIDNYCFMNYKTSTNKRDKTVSFLLRFPFRGFYHLAIMATEVYPSRPDEIVYNYLIRVQDPSNEVERFPIIMNPILWRECSLITPKNYRLSSYDVHFSVIVPRTDRVQVSSDDCGIECLEPKDIENSWVGLVSLQDDSAFVYIEAEFDGKMHKLLRFKGPNYFNKDGI